MRSLKRTCSPYLSDHEATAFIIGSTKGQFLLCPLASDKRCVAACAMCCAETVEGKKVIKCQAFNGLDGIRMGLLEE